MNDIVQGIWLTPEQTATQLSLSSRTLANWRAEGKGPTFVRLGRRIRYPRTEIERFVAKATVHIRSELSPRRTTSESLRPQSVTSRSS